MGLVTGACFAELGHDVVVRDVVPERDRGAAAPGACRSTSPGSTTCSRARASGCASRSTWARRSTAPSSSSSRVGTPPTYSGDADLSAVWTVVDELPAGRRATLVMKSTVPRRAPARRCARARRARPGRRRLRLEPGVPRRGHRRARLHGARPGRRRRVRAGATATRVAALHAGSTRRSSAPTSPRRR